MARPSIEHLNQQIVEHNTHRRHFDRTPLQLAEQIKQEAIELLLETIESYATNEPMTIIGEIGDLYILLAQYCDDLGINPADAIDYKMKRNEYKYPDHTMNNGYSREEAIYLSKRFYAEVIGGDHTFSHAYLEFLADDHDETSN